MQQALFAEQSQGHGECIAVPMADADVVYYPDFYHADQADHYFNLLQHELAWRQERIVIYGKEHWVPRLQAWYGDAEATYHYSSLTLQPLAWTKTLLALKTQCELFSGQTFNSVLANYYRDGQDSMGMHSDDEAELGPRPIIASLSFGQTRVLNFQHKKAKTRHKLPLNHGSLLIMAGATQQNWQHGIAKLKRPTGGRINLTFRRILPA